MDFTRREAFAIYLCEAEHPHRATGHLPVPCGDHRRAADFMHILTTPEGTRLFDAVSAARTANIERTEAERKTEEARQAEAEGRPLTEAETLVDPQWTPV